MSAACPSCGASINGSRCRQCTGKTVAVKHGIVKHGSRFGFPAVCSCCLAKTSRVEQLSKVTQSGGYRRSSHLRVPVCGGCAGVRYAAITIQVIGWLSGLGWAQVAFSNKRPEPAPGLFWGGWIGSIVVAILLTKLLPLWRRAGHTAGCKPVRLRHGDVTFHNKQFVSLSTFGD